MNIRPTLVIIALLAGTGEIALAGPYLFAFSGEAVPFTENNALSGAWIEFSFVIDSDALPDDYFFGGDGLESSSYSSSILQPTLTISGSLTSDGMYDAKGPFTMTVVDADLLFEDSVKVKQNSGGVFDVPGTNGLYASISLTDYSAEVLTGTEVPIDISLDEFADVDFHFKTPEGGGDLNVLYYMPDFKMTITPVPEPTSLVLLALGGAGILLRRCMGVRTRSGPHQPRVQ